MTSDRADQMATLPDWLPLTPAARRRAWEVARAATDVSDQDMAVVALLVRPVAPYSDRAA